MRSALSSKYAQGQLVLVGGSAEESFETPDMIYQYLTENGWTKFDAKSLIVLGEGEESIVAAIEADSPTNCSADQKPRQFKLVSASNLTVYDIVCHDHLFLSQTAVTQLQDRYTPQ